MTSWYGTCFVAEGADRLGGSRVLSCWGLRWHWPASFDVADEHPMAEIHIAPGDQRITMLVDARQIKAARSFLRWKQDQLARETGLALSTIRRLERSEGRIEANFDTVQKIRQALENAGIEFIGSPNLGVRYWVRRETANSLSEQEQGAASLPKQGEFSRRLAG